MTAHVASVGTTAYGRSPEVSSRELLAEAVIAAFDDTDLTPTDLDAAYSHRRTHRVRGSGAVVPV